MKLLFILFILILQPAFAQKLPNPSIGGAVLASKQYLAGKDEESLALYQKAIAKAEGEYGKNSRLVGNLNYELAVRGLSLSKFNLAERCFKKAVEINPNCEAARLMLVQLLRFRNKDAEAYSQTQQGLKKHSDSMSLHRDLILCLQDKNPASATQQAFIINCLQSDNPDKISDLRTQTIEKPATPEINSKAILSPAVAPSKDKHESAPAQVKAKNTFNSLKSKRVSNKNVAVNSSTKSPQRRASLNRPRTSKLPVGLVPPPPPPSALGFPSSRVQTDAPFGELRAKTGSIKPEKSVHSADKPATKSNAEKAPSAEPLQKRSAEPSAGEDPDFLLDWAALKKKRAKQ